MGRKGDRKYGKRRWGQGADLVCQEEFGENLNQESDSLWLMVLGTPAAEWKKTWAGGPRGRPSGQGRMVAWTRVVAWTKVVAAK